jgi:hypothetical protein
MRLSQVLGTLALALPTLAQTVDLGGKTVDPFASSASAKVFLFVRSDCPITNRYAPEMRRIAAEYASRMVEFWLVYPDRAEQTSEIVNHIHEFELPGTPVRDPQHTLVKRAEATIAPEAAVFDHRGHLAYIGRIDDLYVSLGKARPAAQTHDLDNAIAAVLAGKPVAASHTKAFGCYLADVQ